MNVGGHPKRRYSVGRLESSRGGRGTAGKTALKLKLERELNFQKERELYLYYCDHLMQLQHCTDLPLQLTLPDSQNEER